jgi:hypothetical protein
MSMSTRSRNGTHSLNSGLNRRSHRYATSMLAGARRPRQPNDFLVALRLLSQFLRNANRMAKAAPHLCGPRARDYFLDTLRMEQQEKETEAALEKVYGPTPPGQPKHVSTLWSDRYEPRPERRRLFLKWFHEQYPSP